MRRLVDLQQKYQADAAFVLIAIRDAGHPIPHLSPPPSGPRPGETARQTRQRQVREGAEFLNLPFPVLLDVDWETEWAYDAFPKRLVIVGADGRIAYDGGLGTEDRPSPWDLEDIERYLQAGGAQGRIAE